MSANRWRRAGRRRPGGTARAGRSASSAPPLADSLPASCLRLRAQPRRVGLVAPEKIAGQPGEAEHCAAHRTGIATLCPAWNKSRWKRGGSVGQRREDDRVNTTSGRAVITLAADSLEISSLPIPRASSRSALRQAQLTTALQLNFISGVSPNVRAGSGGPPETFGGARGGPRPARPRRPSVAICHRRSPCLWCS
jgi:hypothetical protein